MAEPTRIQQRLRWHLRPLDPEPEAPARSLGHRVRLERVAERLEAMEDTRAPRMAAEVLAEVAGVGRFADPAKLPRSAGLVPCRRPRGRVGAVASIGPATVSSTAPFTGSPSSRPACTARPAGTSRRIAEGETEREARRCRTRHPVNVIFRALAQRAGSLSTGGRLPVAAALT